MDIYYQNYKAKTTISQFCFQI